MGTRKRPIPAKGAIASPSTLKTVNRNIYYDIRPNTSNYSHSWDEEFSHLQGFQITESQNHPAWRDRKSNLFVDIGGPFFTQKRFVEFIVPQVFMRSVKGPDRYGFVETAQYVGPLLPCSPHLMQWPEPSLTSHDNLRELGTTAIARCSPSNPVASLSTLLGETIKDGIPALVGSGLKGLRSMTGRERKTALGKEHLNMEFGWKPFVNDLRKLSEAIVRADALWAQYERDSGKMVRRRYTFPTESSSKTTEMGLYGPYYTPSVSTLGKDSNYKLDGNVLVTDRVTKRRWFSGAFTYYVPDEDRETIAYNVIQAKKLLGLSLTPDTVWNLMPWSWAVDWFANTGDILSNWSNWAIDGQVLWYGYMMEHSTIERTYTYSGDTRLKGDPTVGAVRLVIDTKSRIQAGPYGFGSQYDGLTDRQIGIITALGAAKSK